MKAYLPRDATIEEACEWLEVNTGDKWTLPRLLEEAHLTPHVWIDYIPGYPQIFGDRVEGYLTEMIFQGDVVRLAADRSEALITMFTAHDGNLVKSTPGWKVALKDVRFKGQAIERAAEILAVAALDKDTATPSDAVQHTATPVLKQAAQEKRILELIATAGHDALKLPSGEPGKKGIKSDIKVKALALPSLFTANSFDKAWQRLRDDGRLAGD